jgi:hypothetical protein
LKDALFGDIDYEYGWVGRCSWSIFGDTVVTPLSVPCDAAKDVQAVQREAFIAFEKRKDSMCKLAEESIFNYYLEILPEYRERFGPRFADEWAPEIGTLDEVKRLITPTEVIIQQSFVEPPERVVGLLFDCTWDTSLGLGVKFVDERLAGVGTQDIVL